MKHVEVPVHFVDTSNAREWYSRGKTGGQRLPVALTAEEAEELNAKSANTRVVEAARVEEAQRAFDAARAHLKQVEAAAALAIAKADEEQIWAVERRAYRDDGVVERWFFVPNKGQAVEVTLRCDPGYTSCEVGERRPLTAAELDSVRQMRMELDALPRLSVVEEPPAKVVPFAAAPEYAAELETVGQWTRPVQETAQEPEAMVRDALVSALRNAPNNRLTLKQLLAAVMPHIGATQAHAYLKASSEFQFRSRYWSLTAAGLTDE